MVKNNAVMHKEICFIENPLGLMICDEGNTDAGYPITVIVGAVNPSVHNMNIIQKVHESDYRQTENSTKK